MSKNKQKETCTWSKKEEGYVSSAEVFLPG